MEQIPWIFDQASGLANASRSALLTWRAGADTVDPDSARVLKL
jgi:hypothetical protein